MVTCRYDEIGRWYEVKPNVWYPSVTTMLGYTADHKPLDEWRQRIGEKEAENQTRMAAHFGTKHHSLCEHYLNGDPLPKSDWFSKRLFQQIKPIIDNRVEKVYYTEVFLYSDILQLGGTADAIVKINDKLTVLDFKTAKREKRPEWCLDYFIQVSIYAFMLRERSGIMPEQGALFFSHKVDTTPKEFYIKPTDYYDHITGRVLQFRKQTTKEK